MNLARLGSAGVLARGATLLVQVLTVTVLARLLTPEEYGVVALAQMVTTLFGLVADFGFSQRTLLRDELNDEVISTFFWTSVGVAAALALLAIPLGFLLTRLYDNPGLMAITGALGLTGLLATSGAQHRALLVRRLQMVPLSYVDIATAAAGSCAAILAAWQGAGAWALVFGALLSSSLQTFAVWRLEPWRPRLIWHNQHFTEAIAFGSRLYLFGIGNHLIQNLPVFVIGRVWGVHEAGLYNRAHHLLSLPLNIITTPLTTLMFSILARIRTDRSAYIARYLDGLEALLLTCTPIALLSLLVTPEIIHLLLGEQWSGAAPVMQALSVIVVLSPVVYSFGWIFVSMERMSELVRVSLPSWILTIGMVLAGVSYDVRGVAIALSLAAAIVIWPIGRSAYSVVDLPAAEAWRRALCYLIAGAGATAAVAMLLSELTHMDPLLRCILATAIFMAIYLLALVFQTSSRTYLRRALLGFRTQQTE